jgi:ankyrin repeat protein
VQAVHEGHLSMVKLLLSKEAKEKDATLFHSYPEVNSQIIKYLLKGGANPKATDVNGNTMLHIVCAKGNLKNVKYLIQHYNADVSAKNKQGQTPLHLACRINNLKMVKFLMEEQNADPAVHCNEGKTAFHHAAGNKNGLSILRYLIEVKKQDIEATDNEGRTVLHLACQTFIFFDFEGRWKTQKYLIEDHAKIIEAKDKKGKTALYYCLKNFVEQDNYLNHHFRPIALILATKGKILKKQENKDSDHVCDWIKQSYDKDMKKSKKEDEALSCVIGGLKSFQKELDKKDNTNIEYNPLLYIVDYCNKVDIAEYMFNQDLCYIEKHFNAKEANSKIKLLLNSYLKFSCEKGVLDLTRFLFQEIYNKQKSFHHFTFDGSFLKTACKKKQVDIFKYLLEDEKANDEAAEFLQNFPLHYACRNGSLEMVQYLIITKQIDIELKDNEGRTPLHFACQSGSLEMVQYLIIAKQIDIEKKDKKGITPLHLACHARSIEMAKYLIEKQNANVNITDNKGRSVWHFACMSDCLELVKYISLKTKQDVNAQDEDGSTALHLACKIRNLKVVKFLITDMKADLHSVDKEGKTPIHIACQSYFSTVPIPKFLVNKGANVLAKDKCGKTPLQNQYRNYTELIAFLKAATKRQKPIYNHKSNYQMREFGEDKMRTLNTNQYLLRTLQF